jgi:hypothetical protein
MATPSPIRGRPLGTDTDMPPAPLGTVRLAHAAAAVAAPPLSPSKRPRSESFARLAPERPAAPSPEPVTPAPCTPTPASCSPAPAAAASAPAAGSAAANLSKALRSVLKIFCTSATQDGHACRPPQEWV